MPGLSRMLLNHGFHFRDDDQNDSHLETKPDTDGKPESGKMEAFEFVNEYLLCLTSLSIVDFNNPFNSIVAEDTNARICGPKVNSNCS
jgi:hypothetical protein